MNTSEATAIFRALGDPTRLELMQVLGEGNGVSATELAVRLPITRQAVTKHIAVLSEAGLVGREQRGRAVVYRVEPDVMTEAADWLLRASVAWDVRLAGLGDALARVRDEER
jgi:DNA-binding transcriptional ArsR family regulator